VVLLSVVRAVHSYFRTLVHSYAFAFDIRLPVVCGLLSCEPCSRVRIPNSAIRI
jgi:hypothetical protein